MSSASVKTPVLEPPPRVAAASLNDPSLYIDRELSLLAFQRRVLEEAQDPANALLERVKFLSILFSNLDEFFMVRVAVLKQKAATNVLDGFVAEQLDQIRADVKQVMADAYDTWRDIAKALEGSGIELRELFAAHQSRTQCDGSIFPRSGLSGAHAAGVRPGQAVPAHLEPEPEPGRRSSRRQGSGAIRPRQGSRYPAATGSRRPVFRRTSGDDLAGTPDHRKSADAVSGPGYYRSISVSRHARCRGGNSGARKRRSAGDHRGSGMAAPVPRCGAAAGVERHPRAYSRNADCESGTRPARCLSAWTVRST